MTYRIGERLVPGDCADDSPRVTLVTPAEWAKREPCEGLPPLPEAGFRFCKAEVYPDALVGSISIPVEGGAEGSGFAFAIREGEAILVDPDGSAEALVKRVAETKKWRAPSLGRFVYDLLEALIENDLDGLEEIENALAGLEERVLNNTLERIPRELSELRKRLLRLHGYYAQLTDVGQELMENENEFFSESEAAMFRLFTDRAGRLLSHTQMLQEYSMQVSEVYQAQVDIGQNRVMQILTVVTAVFLPLSLIAGWFGMNFAYMPELRSPYGYPTVIAASVVVAAGLVWLFRRKKFF